MEDPSTPRTRGPGRPLLFLSIAYTMGILAELPSSTVLWWGIIPLLGITVLASCSRRQIFAFFSLLLLFGIGGAIRSPKRAIVGPGLDAGACARALRADRLPPPTEEAPGRMEVEGIVSAPPFLGERSNRLELEVVRGRAAPDPLVLARGPWTETSKLVVELSMQRPLRPLPGDRVRAVITLDDPPPLTPASRRAKERRQRRGIACIGRVQGDGLAIVSVGSGIFTRIESSRRALAATVRVVLPSPAARALVPALMVGDRSDIPDSMREDFTASGLAHVLSVSGLHLSLTVLGLYRILRWLLRRSIGHLVDAHRLAAALVIPMAPLYAAFTGAETPVLRAAVGAGLFLFAQAIARGADGWTSLAVAALGILAWEPSVLFDVSFQLSFAACAGLLGLAPAVRRFLPWERPPPTAPLWRKGLEATSMAFATTLAATLATLPLTAAYFNRISLSSLVANVVAVPVGLVATGLSAFAGALGLVYEPAMVWVLPLAGIAAEALGWLATFFASWPFARIPLATPTPWEWGFCVAALFSLGLLPTYPRRASLCLLASLSLLVTPFFLPKGDGKLVVDFLPIGQGDATLLRLPGGEAILVDTGGDLLGEVDLAGLVLLPLLAERGVTKLHALVLSHLHPDHVGSAPTLLRSLPVEEVWFTGRRLEGKWGGPIAEAMVERGIPLRTLFRGAPALEVGGVRFEALGPPDRDALGDDPLLGDNDASLVLRVVHGAVRILLPGDIEKEGERELVAFGADLRADLLKAPHHGSKTSSTEAFVEKVRPAHVVFCVGWRNGFGFPNSEVVERYRRHGVEMHRTDRGQVHFVSDGTRLSAEAGLLLEDGDQAAVVLPHGREDHGPLEDTPVE